MSEINLGSNSIYKDAINRAAQRTGMEPEAIAAVISAEAARGPNGVWNPNSYNKASKAQGLTQFIPGTWLMMARTPGTALNERVAGKGLTNQQILDLRTDPELSIVTAAEYDSGMVSALQKQGVIPRNLTPTQKAQYAYLAHHEGQGGASQILRNTLTDARARKLLPIQVGKAKANQLIAAHGGDAAAAYKDWLNGYIQKNIQPDRYRAGPQAQPQLKGTLPAAPETPPADKASGGPRIQNGESSVLIGAQQWMAAHVDNPHKGGGKLKEGSQTVFVGPLQLPFSRKGDMTTDQHFVRGDTQPDIFVGGAPTSFAERFNAVSNQGLPAWAQAYLNNPSLFFAMPGR